MSRLKSFLDTRRGKIVASVAALMVLLGAGAIFMGASADEEDVAAPVAAPAWTNALQREMEVQRQRHVERVERLKAIRERLAAARAPAEEVELVNQAIAAEQADYQARATILQRWARGPAPVAPAEERLGRAIDNELRDLGAAIDSLNQSFVIPPIRTRSASAGGSRFIDVEPDVAPPPAAVPPPGAAPPPAAVPPPAAGPRPPLEVD